MIKTLILEDNGFFASKEALHAHPSLKNEIFILNDESIHDEIEIYYRDVAKIMDKYHTQIDLLVVDIELPDKNNNGLVAINNWIIDQENLNANALNFGIVVVTNHADTYVREVLENAANLFGNCFLGYVTKGEALKQQLQNLITNAFITPPFVRGGDKYFNTKLLEDKFPIFKKVMSINGKDIPFYKIIAVQQKADGYYLKIYTTEGILCGLAYLNQKPIDPSDFFEKDFCYDAAKFEGRLNYVIDANIWENNRPESEETIKQNAKERIAKSLESSFPAFVCVGRFFAINPLYLLEVNNVRPNLFEIKGYLKPYELCTPSKPEGYKLRLDPEADIRGNINIDAKDSYIPLYGRTLQSLDTTPNKNGEYRIANPYHDRLFLFRELSSSKWKPLLTQLKRHYNHP